MAAYELSWPANARWRYVKALRTEEVNYMETVPLTTEARAFPVWSASTQERRELQPDEISTLSTLTELRETTDEEFELIEMCYAQALARTGDRGSVRRRQRGACDVIATRYMQFLYFTLSETHHE